MITNHPAVKLTCCGQSILLLDEREHVHWSKQAKAAVSIELASSEFGVGCDIVVFLHPNEGSQILDNRPGYGGNRSNVGISCQQGDIEISSMQISAYRVSGHNACGSTEVVFAVAHYLYELEGKSEVWFDSKDFLERTVTQYVYRDRDTSTYNIALNEPRSVSDYANESLYNEMTTPVPGSTVLELLEPIATLSEGVTHGTFITTCMEEPIAVCLIEDDSPLFDMFINLGSALDQLASVFLGSLGDDKRLFDFGLSTGWCSDVFAPFEGFHVVFARPVANSGLEARFYSRGSCREVRMIGTGAAASVLIAQHLGRVGSTITAVHGLRNVMDGRDWPVHVQVVAGTWWLSSRVATIWTGNVRSQTR